MSRGPVYSRALLLAEQFLEASRSEILALADDDLEQLRAVATELRSAAADRGSAPKGPEHIAYLIVASAFNQALAARDRR